MASSINEVDENGVRKIGGHTLRMRDFGDDQIPGTDDDLLNIAGCQTQGCHPELTDFDINGTQTKVKELLTTLATLLKENNHEFLPANEPGSCARCHKGGTVPFLDDPDGTLENAYTNYKLILNDRSLGIHNPGYVIKLLQDSISSIKTPPCSATYLFGENDPRLNTLREFRDNVLSKSAYGRVLIQQYYLWSPLIVEAMGNNEELKVQIKETVDKILEVIDSQ
jgi:hypothetical protein